MKFLPFYCGMDNDIVLNNTIIKKKLKDAIRILV